MFLLSAALALAMQTGPETMDVRLTSPCNLTVNGDPMALETLKLRGRGWEAEGRIIRFQSARNVPSNCLKRVRRIFRESEFKRTKRIGQIEIFESMGLM